MAEPFVAAVDGGGSKTATLIAWRDGRVRCAPEAGGCNPQDNPEWGHTLGAALAPLVGAAHVTVGLGGFGEVPEIDARVRAKVEATLGPGVTVMNDVALAARAAFPSGGGVLVLSGTGSMAVAAGPLAVVRAGGWGDLFSDEGSAFWIGREALALAGRERDGVIPDRGLARALEARLGLADRGHYALLGWTLAQGHPRSDVARLARIIDDLAEGGLAPARDILAAAARELSLLAHAAARQAGLAGPRPWAHAGSVFRSRTVRDAVARHLAAPPVMPEAGALAGGLVIAAEAAGWNVNEDWRAKVRGALVTS